jgi:hypothetical protein
MGSEGAGFGDDFLTLARRPGDRPKWSERLPMNMDTVRRVAQDWDIRIDDLTIRIDKVKDGLAGVTFPNQMVLLRRAAFRSEELLARTLAHERFHVEDIRGGGAFPKTLEEAEPWEDRAYAFEDDWWDNHPRNQ